MNMSKIKVGDLMRTTVEYPEGVPKGSIVRVTKAPECYQFYGLRATPVSAGTPSDRQQAWWYYQGEVKPYRACNKVKQRTTTRKPKADKEPTYFTWGRGQFDVDIIYWCDGDTVMWCDVEDIGNTRLPMDCGLNYTKASLLADVDVGKMVEVVGQAPLGEYWGTVTPGYVTPPTCADKEPTVTPEPDRYAILLAASRAVANELRITDAKFSLDACAVVERWRAML